MGSRLSYPTENWVLDNGGEVLWLEGVFSTPKGGALRVYFLCAARRFLGDGCEGRGEARASHVLRRRGRTFSALHEECYRNILGRPGADRFVTVTKPLSFGEFPLPQGTVAILHKRAPNPGKKFAKIAIKCRGCYDESKDNLKYTNSLNLRLYAKGCVMRGLAVVGFAHTEDKTTWCRVWPHLNRFRYWSELCRECVKKRGSVDRFTGWKTSPSGTKVFFPEDRNAPAQVHYALCKCVKEVSRNTAINNYDELAAACRTHTGELLKQMALNGTGQKNGGEEKGPHDGSRNLKWTPELKADLLARYEDFLRRIKDEDATLPDEVKRKLQLRGNKPSDIALDYVAEQMGVESNEYLRRTVLRDARRDRAKG
jgi:hypothetical protein